MERRASLRRPVWLAAQLQIASFGQWPCQIADICAGGLFIRIKEDVEQVLGRQPALLLGQKLEISFRDGQEGLSYTLAVCVARHIPGALGVYFTDVNARSMSALLRLCGTEDTSESASLRPGPKGGAMILRQCLRYLAGYLEPLLSAYVVSLEALLREEASRAASNQQVGEFLDAAVQFRTRQRPFCQQMIQALSVPVRPLNPGKGQVPLALVAKDEFEEWLTLRVMIAKAETRLRSSLLPLRMRLDKAGVVNETGQHYPLGPVLICHTLQQTLMDFHLSRSVEKTCLHHFEQQVVSQLDGLYEELNRMLIRQGLLPNLDSSRCLSPDASPAREDASRKKPAAPTPAVSPAESAESLPKSSAPFAAASRVSAGNAVAVTTRQQSLDQAYQSDHEQAEQALSTVQSLLQALRASKRVVSGSGATPFVQGAPRTQAADTQVLRQQLEQLAAPVSAEGNDVPLARRVEQVLSAASVTLNEEQQEALDIVDQFFASLRRSPRLSAITREQLLRLESSVLKAVWQDRSFFSRPDSPLRAIFNRIAQLGARGIRPDSTQQQRVNALIERLQAGGMTDQALLQETLSELDELEERQSLIYRRNVERLTAAAEGSQKIEDARQAVHRELSARLAGRRVPQTVLSLIDGGWRDLLVLTHIRQGTEGTQWQQYLAVLDSLLGFAGDRSTSINMAELLNVIQEGLLSISGHQIPAGHLRDELRRLLVSPAGTEEWVQMPDAQAHDPHAELRRLSETRNRNLQRWIGRARKLQLGDWFRHRSIGGETQSVHLAWIGPDHARFVFVNHKGMKVIEQDLRQMASQLQQGLLVPDPEFDRPIVDESVDRMVQQMYEQLAWATGHDELTGLLTRAELERRLSKWLEGCGESGNWSLLQLDLRQFRLLNETGGADAGNKALRMVADCLKARVPDEQSLLSRIMADIFLLMVPTGEAESLARQLIKDIGELPWTFAGRDYRLTASAGLAKSSSILVSSGLWMRAVDDACSEAKRSGGGQVRWYQADVAELVQQEQIAIRVADLGNLDGERILLCCQKIIPLQAQARLGSRYEVLISMLDAEGGIISATRLLRTAKRYNRMQMVDRWVAGQTLDWMRRHPGELARTDGLFINLSGHSLNDVQLLEFLYETLSQPEMPLAHIGFEITEASAIRNLDEVADFIREMKALGCRFCLGNFGAGSMAYAVLKALPVDAVKLDGLFARSLSDSPADQAVVRSLVEMAHFLGREVIASQIETAGVFDQFKDLGVDYAQGYLIEEPQLLDKLGLSEFAPSVKSRRG